VLAMSLDRVPYNPTPSPAPKEALDG
jgi:hypothetical protein